MNYAEREHELAVAVLADPMASPEDKATARARLKSGRSFRTEDDFDRLDEGELEILVHITRKLDGDAPEDLDAYSARDRADNAQQYADRLRAEATLIAAGRAVPPAWHLGCARCRALTDDDLRKKNG